jgi:hypothetical protein
MKTQMAAGALMLAAGLTAAPLAHAAGPAMTKAEQAQAAACHSPASASFMRDLTSRANQPSALTQLWHDITGKSNQTEEIEPLKIGHSTKGTLAAPEQMVLVSDQPLRTDRLDLRVEKLGGNATTPIVVCLTDRNGNELVFSETTIPADAGLAEARVNLAGLQDKFVSVRIAPEGSGKIEYQVSARPA